MSTKHTPGPWVASYDTCNTGAPYMVGAPVSEALPAHAHRHIGNAYLPADAAVMAAGPDLLAWLRAALVIIDDEIEHRKQGQNERDWAPLQAVSEYGHLAIRKAEHLP